MKACVKVLNRGSSVGSVGSIGNVGGSCGRGTCGGGSCSSSTGDEGGNGGGGGSATGGGGGISGGGSADSPDDDHSRAIDFLHVFYSCFGHHDPSIHRIVNEHLIVTVLIIDLTDSNHLSRRRHVHTKHCNNNNNKI